jgi:hypothetical protein
MHSSRSLIVAAFILAVGGCGGDSGTPPVYEVTGVVTRNGQPVEGAVVMFISQSTGESSTPAPGGQAETGADGAFSVQSTFDQGKTMQTGLPAGTYKITVVKLQSPAGGPSITSPPKNILPPEYSAAESTPLSATIKAEGTNRVDVTL